MFSLKQENAEAVLYRCFYVVPTQNFESKRVFPNAQIIRSYDFPEKTGYKLLVVQKQFNSKSDTSLKTFVKL